MLRFEWKIPNMMWDGVLDQSMFRAPRLSGANAFEMVAPRTAKELILKFKDMPESKMIMLHGCLDPHNFKKELLRLEKEIIDATLDGKI